MNISVKKFSKKSLSLLIALIMVFSALPLTPPISADAAETKTEISVWDASNVTVNGYNRRFSAVDSSTGTSFSGICFDTVTRPSGSNYVTLSNAAASFAVFDSSTASNENGALTSTGFDKGISGDHWSVTATFAYLTSNSTTIFGIGTSAERNYTYTNDYKSKGNVADLVDIRANGSVYVGTGTGDSNTLESKGTVLTSSELISNSATDTKTITVEYNTGVLKIYLNDVVKATYDVDTALFSAGVGNFFMGRNCQVFGGGRAPYYKITGGDYLGTMNFYSLSGATYTTNNSHDNPNQTINVAGFGVVKHSSSNADRRKDNNTAINIVNDRYHSNFDIGFINFNISGLKNSDYVSVKNAICAFQARYADSGDNKGLKLYYPTKNVTEFTTNSAAISGNATAVQLTTSNSSIFGSNQGANSTHLAATINYYGLTEIPSGEFTDLTSSYADKRLDISEAINYALDNNLNYATVIILLKEAGNATNSGSRNWTDTYFKFTSRSITATAVDACIWNDYHPDPANAGQHIRECEVCHKTETQACSGGAATCTQRAICSVCGGEYGSRAQHSFEINSLDFDRLRVESGAVNNGYYYAGCKSCGVEDTRTARVYDKTDWSTYDSQKRVLDVLLADGSKFTAASLAACRNDYNTATSGVTSGDETKSQTFIDNKVEALIAAKNLLKSTVTLNIYDFSSGNPELLGNSAAKDVAYLSTETLSIPEEYQNEYTVYQWKINNKGVDKVIGSNSYSINAIVNDNVTYNVYLKKNAIDEAEASKNAVVTLVNKSNNAIDIAYIAKSETAQTTTVDCGNRTITIGGVALTAPKYAFYNLKGFDVNGTKVYDTAEIVINDNITIRPIYSASSTLQIDCASAVSINGNAVQSYQAKWDEPIVIKADREVVWYTESNGNEIILGQGNTFRFRANENIVILTKDVPQTLEPCAKIGYFQYDVELNKVTVVNNFFVPEGKIVRAAGVILSTKTNDIEQMKKQSTGKFIVDPSKFTENGNQVRISVTRTANNAFNMHALAYVEFTDGTVCYSKEVVTCSYTPA